MTDFNWKYEILQCTDKKRKIKPFQKDESFWNPA